MKSHPSEGEEIVLEKGHGTNPKRDERGRNFFPLPLDSSEESVLRRLASLSRSSFHLPFPSFVSCREQYLNHNQFLQNTPANTKIVRWRLFAGNCKLFSYPSPSVKYYTHPIMLQLRRQQRGQSISWDAAIRGYIHYIFAKFQPNVASLTEMA